MAKKTGKTTQDDTLTGYLGVRVDQETVQRLKAQAKRERRRAGDLHRIILEDGLEQRERQPEPIAK
jgi:hypothetical protein